MRCLLDARFAGMTAEFWGGIPQCVSSSTASRRSARRCSKRCSSAARTSSPSMWRRTKPGAKADPLLEAAMAANLPVFQPDLQEARSVGAIPRAQARPAGDGVRDAVRAGGLPQHPDPRLDPVPPSLLPAYRGASAINWPIIKGEKETGLSIFWPDNGLDTGDVLVQKTTPISDTDTLGTVYFDRLFPLGVEAMLDRSTW